MFIKKIYLKDFRNYEKLELPASPGINVIYGRNGQGKTNILEALFLCAIGKSFRTSHDTEMIKNDKKEYFVEIQIGDNLFSKISVRYDRKKSKIICVDGACISKMRFLMGKLVAVMFSPEDMRLVSEGPSQRRKFIDIAICQLSSSYYHSLLMYNKAVKEKNILLASDYNRINRIALEAYNETIAQYGADIYCERIKFLERLSFYASESHLFISEKNEKLSVKYLPACSYVNEFCNKIKSDDSLKILKETIKNEFLIELNSEKNILREIERRKCVLGPHRDDFDIFFNNVNLKQYGSQGQKRTAVISIKHAELQIMKEVTGRMPVLFLDDVMSELDSLRKKKLIECFKDVQVFITCADEDIIEYLNKSEVKANYINAESLR